MLYNFVRWVVFFTIIGLVLLIIKKSPIKNHNMISKIIPIIVAVVCFFQWNIPIENYIYSFSSLEKSFNYCSVAKKVEILGSFEAQSSGLVLYKSENGYANYIAQKTVDGWKISNIKTCIIESVKTRNGYTIAVYHIKNTPDRYVLISTDFADDIAKITDSKGNAFRYVEDNDSLLNHIIYFNCYSENDFDYVVYINDEKFNLKN